MSAGNETRGGGKKAGDLVLFPKRNRETFEPSYFSIFKNIFIRTTDFFPLEHVPQSLGLLF